VIAASITVEHKLAPIIWSLCYLWNSLLQIQKLPKAHCFSQTFNFEGFLCSYCHALFCLLLHFCGVDSCFLCIR